MDLMATEEKKRTPYGCLGSNALNSKPASMPFYLLPCLLFIASITPLAQPVSGRDSAAFQYVAREVSNGSVLYKEVWDHKPPLIYMIDGLSLLFGGRWGLWCVEICFLIGSIILANLTLALFADRRIVRLAIFYWMATVLLVADGGGMPELFAQPLLWGCFYCVSQLYLYPKSCSIDLREISLGFIGGLLLLLKPTLIAVPVAASIYTVIGRAEPKRAFARALNLSVGAAVPILAVVAYLYINGAISAAHEAIIQFNGAYATATFNDRLRALFYGLKHLSYSCFGILSLGSFLYALINFRLLSRKGVREIPLNVALLAFPFDLLGSAAPGRDYPHYFLTCLPSGAVLLAYGFTVLEARTRQIEDGLRKRTLNIAMTVSLLLPTLYLVHKTREIRARSTLVELLKQEIVAGPPGKLLVWGAEPQVYLATGRNSPTRFFYSYPVTFQWPGREAAEQEFKLALTEDPPVFLVDASFDNSNVPPFTAFLESQRDSSLYNWFRSNYTAIELQSQVKLFKMRSKRFWPIR